MEWEEVRSLVVALEVEGRHDEAKQLLDQHKAMYKWHSLGRWYHLYARIHHGQDPDDRETLTQLLPDAVVHLQKDYETLCELYLLYMGASIRWGDMRAARNYIRRIRGLSRKHPANLAIQRLTGSVLINEGLIERSAGNLLRAARLLLQGVDTMIRFCYPTVARTRQVIVAMARLDAADCYLRLGDNRMGLKVLAQVDPRDVTEHGRYCYVQARYWLSVSAWQPAESWLDRIEDEASWDRDFAALIMEVRAKLAWAKGERDRACSLLTQGILLAKESSNGFLVTALECDMDEMSSSLNI